MAKQPIEQLPPLPETLEEFDLRANSEASRFYEGIETLLRRHQPDVWGPFASRQLREAWRNPKDLAYAPPHFVLNSIEANCAYVRGQNHDPVDRQRFFKVMSVYVDRTDLWQCWLASKELSHLALAMVREQIELQYQYTGRSLVRFIELFSSAAIPTLSTKFHEQYGLTTDDWIRLCFGIFAHARETPDGYIWRRSAEAFAAEKLNISPTGTDSFFRLSASTPKEIGDRYKELRKGKARFHSLIRSAFLERPMIAFDDGRLLVPHPELVFRHCGEGLSRVLKELPGFQDKQAGFREEFGDAVERYVSKVLSCVTEKMLLLRSGQLKKKPTTGKSCDLLLETVDSIFLVESKSTGIRANILTEEVIRDDGSNKHVTKGLAQLSQTAMDIRQGVFDSYGVDSSKPIIGMVVTLGEIPFANTDWYFDNFFRQRAEERIGTSVDANFGLSERPAVVSVAAFEMVVSAIELFKMSPLTLFKEKAGHSYITRGDWEGFLRHKLSVLGSTIDPFPFVTEQVNAFCESVGIPHDESSKAVFRVQSIGVQTSKSL